MLDLTKLSFEDVVEQLKLKLLEKDAWKDVNLSSTGTVLIELYAYVLQLLLYYLKRTAEEQFPRTAQFWQSLVRIANVLGIHVKRPRGAEGTVRLRLRGDFSGDMKVVKAFTRVFCDDVVLYTVDDVVVEKGGWSEVRVRQGERRVIEFEVNKLAPVIEFVIDDVSASYDDLVVKVGGSVYEVVTDLFEVLGKNVVRVLTLPDRRLALQFFRAFAPLNVGQVVKVEYSSVIEGWMPGVDASWSIEDEGVEIEAEVRSFVSGGRWEGVEELRSRLVNYFGVGKRVVTREDLEKILLSVEGVEKVKVVDVKDGLRYPFGGAVAYVKPVGGYELSDVLRDRISDVVGRLSLLGVKVNVFGVQRVDIDVYVVVKGKVGISVEVIKEQVVKLLKELYDKAEIGKWIYRSEILSLLRVNMVDVVDLVLPQQDLQLFDNQIVVLRNVRVDVV